MQHNAEQIRLPVGVPAAGTPFAGNEALDEISGRSAAPAHAPSPVGTRQLD